MKNFKLNFEIWCIINVTVEYNDSSVSKIQLEKLSFDAFVKSIFPSLITPNP